MGRKQKIQIVFFLLTSLVVTVAHAQVSSSQTSTSMSMSRTETHEGEYWGWSRIANGGGMHAVSAVSAGVAVSLAVSEAPGGGPAAIAFGTVSAVVLVAGIVEMVGGANQLRAQRTQQTVVFTGQGLSILF